MALHFRNTWQWKLLMFLTGYHKINHVHNITISIQGDIVWHVTLFALLSNIHLYMHGFMTSHWRRNDHDGVSNHQPRGCLLNRLFRRRWKKTSKLRVTGLCAGISQGPVNFPHKGPVTRKMFPFDAVIMICSARKYSRICIVSCLPNISHNYPRIRLRDRLSFICHIHQIFLYLYYNSWTKFASYPVTITDVFWDQVLEYT